jgi:hypothetical protein
MEDLIDREEQAQALLARAEEANNSRLVAPRRYGKTSLLRRVSNDATARGWISVYVNFFGVLTLGDVASRIESAYAEQLTGRIASWFTGVRQLLRPAVRAGGGPIPASVELRTDAPDRPALTERLDLPRELHRKHDRRVFVVFDEFQDVLAAAGNADAVIRSVIEQHDEAASYIFAGSDVGMMRELFASRRRAFYGQAAPVDLPPLDPAETGAYVTDRFAATGKDIGGALEPLLTAAQGHPQRSMLLAHAVWEATEAGRPATTETWLAAYSAVMHAVADEFRTTWKNLTLGQRRVLTTIGDDNGGLYATNRRYGGSRGGAISDAVTVLEERGDVVADPAHATGYRVVDPLFAAWLVAGRPGD